MFTITLNKYTYYQLDESQKTFISANYNLAEWSNFEYYRTKTRFGSPVQRYIWYVVYTHNNIRFLRNFELDESPKKYCLATFFNNELVKINYPLEITEDDDFEEKKLPTEFLKKENTLENEYIYTMITDPAKLE
jgi:hypothetical protein